ncbi:hypothetical protein IT774_11015 [Salinimonas marina]|uniref:Phosphate ABC transporter substrate-binding protein n=2 Tax=Salinimonas marina TaxID=2785918 RepID=A0A7S9E0G9_9ALTE|nr:hypothetical protein IT774_11015 [Salinimonas marina]
MRRLLASLLLFFICNIASGAERVIVVANTEEHDFTLKRTDIRELFMSGSSPFNATLSPVTIAPGAKSRAIFNTLIIGLPESRIQAYWAQMKFSGRLTPPKEVRTVEDMLDYLSGTAGTIGYLPENTSLPAHLQVVYKTR